MNNTHYSTLFISASDARKEWSRVVDEVVRNKPQFVKRTRDNILISDFSLMKDLLDAYHYTAIMYREDDNTFTLSLNEMDLIVNGVSEEDAKSKMAQEILEYAQDFYENYQFWSVASNRRTHIPYVLKALILQDNGLIGDSISWQHGKN